MEVLEKIQKLTDKKNGPGIPMSIIGRYCHCHPNSISYYIKGAEPQEKVIQEYEEGLNNLLKDIKNIIED